MLSGGGDESRIAKRVAVAMLGDGEGSDFVEEMVKQDASGMPLAP